MAYCPNTGLPDSFVDSFHVCTGCYDAIGQCAVVALWIVVGIGMVIGLLDWMIRREH